MFREVEIVFWASLNTASDIRAIIDKYSSSSKKTVESLILRDIVSRLMLTAYTTKDKLSTTRTNQAMTAFFSKHFGNFISKHTQWSLLSEPDSSRITPKVLNVTRR